jgi:hypothetical protein
VLGLLQLFDLNPFFVNKISLFSPLPIFMCFQTDKGNCIFGGFNLIFDYVLELSNNLKKIVVYPA